jgi:hypothetical protein
MESPAGEAASVEDDDPLSRSFDMLEQAPSANAIKITDPRRSPAANRSLEHRTERCEAAFGQSDAEVTKVERRSDFGTSGALRENKRVNRRIPDVRWAAFYPSMTRVSSGAQLLDAENPAEV